MKRVAIISWDSEIGQGVGKLHQDRGDSVVATTREAKYPEHQRLELKDRSTWKVLPEVDRLYYCIGIGDNGVTPTEIMQVNAIWAIQWLNQQALSMAPGSQIVVFSSLMGSVGKAINSRSLTYRMSKAALNMGIRGLAHNYSDIHWCLYHPGIVKTRMLGDSWQSFNFEALSVDEASLRCVDRIDNWDGSFKFLSYDGQILPW